MNAMHQMAPLCSTQFVGATPLNMQDKERVEGCAIIRNPRRVLDRVRSQEQVKECNGQLCDPSARSPWMNAKPGFARGPYATAIVRALPDVRHQRPFRCKRSTLDNPRRSNLAIFGYTSHSGRRKQMAVRDSL